MSNIPYLWRRANGSMSQFKRLLWRDNARRRPEQQCHNVSRVTTNRAGVPYVPYCGSWQCWIHKFERVRREHKRLLIGMLWLVVVKRLPLYFVRLSRPEPEPSPLDLSRLMSVLRAGAKAAGCEVHYFAVQVTKPSNGAWHAHMVVTWLPSPVPVPSPSRPERVVSEKFETWCDTHGFETHTETVHSVAAVARYMANNLRETVQAGDVPRVTASRSWHHERQPVEDCDVSDFLSAVYGALYGRVSDSEPIRIHKALAVDTWRKSGDLLVYGRLTVPPVFNIQKIQKFGDLGSGDGHGDKPAATSHEPVQLPLFEPEPAAKKWHWLSRWRRCSKCGRLWPSLMYHRSGGGRRRGDCRLCAGAYDAWRDSTHERKSSRRWQRWLRRYHGDNVPENRLL